MWIDENRSIRYRILESKSSPDPFFRLPVVHTDNRPNEQNKYNRDETRLWKHTS